MAKYPGYLRPQTFDVEPGTIKYSGPGGEMSDYSFQRPETGVGQIPQSLRESAFGQGNLRPLLQVHGDNGGPLSAADMENNQNAMNSLDDYFSVQPSQRALQLQQLEAEQTKAEALSDDPLFYERGKADLDMARKSYELQQKANIDRETESGRRNDMGSEVDDLMAETQAALSRAGTPEQKDAIAARHQEQLQSIREKYGVGAKLGASSLYKAPGAF